MSTSFGNVNIGEVIPCQLVLDLAQCLWDPAALQGPCWYSASPLPSLPWQLRLVRQR